MEPIGNLDSNSKRAGPKPVTKRSSSPSGTKKLSRILGESILSRKKSSSKGKSAITAQVKLFKSKVDPSSSPMDDTCPIKPLPNSSGGPAESMEDDDDGNKTISSPEKGSSWTKHESSDEEVPSYSERLESEDEARLASPPLRRNGFTPGNTIVLAIGSVSGKAMKRKKVQVSDIRKKCRTDKGNNTVSTSRKSVPKKKAARAGAGNLDKKRRISDGRVSVSPLENSGGARSLELHSKRVSFAFCFLFMEIKKC